MIEREKIFLGNNKEDPEHPIVLTTQRAISETETFPSINDAIHNKKILKYENIGKAGVFCALSILSVGVGLKTIIDGFQEPNLNKIEGGAGLVFFGIFLINPISTAKKTINQANRQIHKLKTTHKFGN